MEVSNVTDDWGCLGLAGPLSRRVLSSLVDDDLSCSDAAFPHLHCRRMSVAGVAVRAVRTSYTGELGWELYVPPDGLVRVYDALTASGDVADFGAYALDALRIEKGLRAWGREMSVDTDAYEAGLGDVVRLDKEFVGREALTRLAAEGARRRLVLLAVDADDVDAAGYESVWYGERVVGHTTSGAYGATAERSLAFAFVPPELAPPGTEMHVELLGERRAAVVLDRAPVKTDVERVHERQLMDEVAAATLRYDTIYHTTLPPV